MMTERKFTESMDSLMAQMPKRSIKGTVVVDQVYAHYQHANPQFNHPRGGGAFYLSRPLFFKAGEYLARIGRHVVNSAGVVGVERAMRVNMEDLSNEVRENAPIEFGDLQESGHPIVEKDGEVVYDRPPVVGRLSEAALRAKGHLRYLDHRRG